MSRWNISTRKYEECPELDAFMLAIADVCKQYGMCIGHEDCEGSFQITKLSDEELDWLMAANNATEEA